MTLGTAPVGKLLLKLAIPTITAQLVSVLYNMVDRVFIGHIPGVGANALTGVGVCLPIIVRTTSGNMAVYAFIIGVVLSTSVPIMVSFMMGL